METTQIQQAPDFRIFKGPNNREMPKLIAADLVPGSAVQLMCGFLEGKLGRDRYHDSGDAIMYHPDNGRVKLVWDSDDLRKLNLESPLSAGALVLPYGAWESVEGRELSADDVARYTGRRQSKKQAKGNPFWQWLARDDQNLFEAYVDEMFGRVKQRYNLDEAMGIYLASSQENAMVLRLWCLGSVDYDVGFAGGLNLLDSYFGRLAGVASAGGAAGKKGARKRAAQNNGPYREPSYPKRPSLEEVLAEALPVAQKYAADVCHADLEKELTARLSKLYHR